MLTWFMIGATATCSDGPCGQLSRVVYVLVQTGRLLGRKNVAVPARAVARMDAGIRLDLTRREVRYLPPVNLQHQDR